MLLHNSGCCCLLRCRYSWLAMTISVSSFPLVNTNWTSSLSS